MSIVHTLKSISTMRLKLFFIILTTSLLKFIKPQNMSGHIVGGDNAIIEDFPHAALLDIMCSEIGSYCGASILNHAILLTAAHCVDKCKNKKDFEINAFTGHVEKYKGELNTVIGFKVHEDYAHDKFKNDIALLILEKDLKFGRGVKRVILMKYPPKYSSAKIAGWGWIDDKNTKSEVLRHTSQKIISYEKCSEFLPGLPKGIICGFNPSGSHPQRGDSGSALVIHKFIQIGLASHYKRKFSNTTLVYTDVTYFYDWIQKTARELYCRYEYETEEI